MGELENEANAASIVNAAGNARCTQSCDVDASEREWCALTSVRDRVTRAACQLRTSWKSEVVPLLFISTAASQTLNIAFNY